MNHSSTGLQVSKAILGFLQYKTAEGLAPTSLTGYERDLQLWLEYQGNVNIGEIISDQLIRFLNFLRQDYVPRRITGKNDRKLSPKTIYNIYVSLASFFSWTEAEFHISSPMKRIPRPKAVLAPMVPFTREDIERLLKACDYCDEAKTNTRRKFSMRRATARRDKALIVMLLDTGLRASEICSLRVGDVDLKTGKVIVKHGVDGGAKGGKGRTVYLGKNARRILWRYLAEREDGENEAAPLFEALLGRSLTRDALRQVIQALGKKANVHKCHPHKFRHTFAITYLRSGGDIFTLKSLLGHNSLEMVEHYARIAEVDIECAHRRASPADNWHL